MSKSLPGTIIKNRDTEPMLSKAGSILTAYEQAADCVVSVIGTDGGSPIPQRDTSTVSICSYCCKHTPDGGCGKPGEGVSCGDVHQKGIEESRRLGSSYIYMCPLGLVFWVSPLYSGGRYAGALLAGNVLGIEREEALERVQSCCPDGAVIDRIRDNLKLIPRRDFEEIKALAQMMLICAQQISSGAMLSGKNEDRQENEAPLLRPGMPEEPAARLPETAQPSSNERLLIAALRRGDGNAARRILKDIFDDLKAMCPGDLRFFRCRAIELVVFLSRSCASEKTTEPLLEENNLYLKKINDSATIEELQSNLYRIIERMAGRIFSFHGLRHASALRRAERYIWKNYTRKVSLEEIATASGLSAPYFSTIFREEMGEHLSTHLNRLRVEKACTMLLETRATLNEISESCGFEDQSWFSKIFKSYTGYSPGKYREQGGMNYSLDNCHVG